MQFSAAGLSLIKAMESCRLVGYGDSNKPPVPTIGWGHTGPEVSIGLVWTQDRADAQLLADIARFANGVRALVTNPALNDNQFSALVSLAYNIGLRELAGSSALHLANEGDLGDVPAHMALWDKDTEGGRLVVSKGLVGRRAAECALWSLEDDSDPLDWNAIRAAAERNAS